MVIEVQCPDCGKMIKVKLNIVDRMQARINDLQATLNGLKLKSKPPERPDCLNDIFKHFKY